MKKKHWLIFKLCIFYLIGLTSFSIIAFITQRILISILMDLVIDPTQDLYNLSNYILEYSKYYLTAYTTLHFLILYIIRKYDRYIVNKLNEKLEQRKGVDENGKR